MIDSCDPDRQFHENLQAMGGWIDVPRALELVLRRNPACDIVFESSSLFRNDPSWIAEGEQWVRGLVALYGGAGAA